VSLLDKVSMCICCRGKCKTKNVRRILQWVYKKRGATIGECRTPPPTPPPVNNATHPIIEEFRETVAKITLEVLPGPLFDVIAKDSPRGFVPGTVVLEDPSNELVVDGFQDYPLMNFQSNAAGVFSVKAYFLPDDSVVGGIPNGTTVRIYSADGHAATTSVDPMSGYFSAAITDVPPGRTIFLMTFSSPEYDGSANRRLELDNATTWVKKKPGTSGVVAVPETSSRIHKTPCPLWSDRTELCDAQLTFKLTWDQPTSDLDLHVVEPNGAHVYYGNKSGDDGFLDVDDTDGYGPEHYIAGTVTTGNDYAAYVHCFSVNMDEPPISYMLTGRLGETIVWTQEGSLADDEQSPSYLLHADTVTTTKCTRYLTQVEDYNVFALSSSTGGNL